MATATDERKAHAGRGHPKWRTCDHYFPIEHSCHYPSGNRYGSIAVCIRCRCRRFTDVEAGESRLMPPIPLDWKKFGMRHRVPDERTLRFTRDEWRQLEELACES